MNEKDIKYYVLEEFPCEGGILTEYDTYEEAFINYKQSEYSTALIKGVIIRD